jgi:hypothetical protein
MTHPDGKEASHPRAPRTRRGRAAHAKSTADPSALERAAGYETDDEFASAAAQDVALDEETAALPEPVDATGAGGAVVLSDEADDDDVVEDDIEGDIALPFMYDDEDDDADDDDNGDDAADDVAGVDQELADQQALLRRAGQILGSLGREPVLGADDEEEEDGEFQWADDDDPGEQVTLVDEEWLQKVASHAVRRVAARAGDVPAIEASADQDAFLPTPAKLELTLLEPVLTTRLQSPASPAARQDRAEIEEPVADNHEDDDEAELVPLLTEAAYEPAAAEADAAEQAEDSEISAFAPAPDDEPEPPASDQPAEESFEDGVVAKHEARDADGDYHALMIDAVDAAPLPGDFEDFAARGGRMADAGTIRDNSVVSAIAPSVAQGTIPVTAYETGGAVVDTATSDTNTVLVPEVAAQELVPADNSTQVDDPTPEPATAANPVSQEDAPDALEQQPAVTASNPPLGHEFPVTPGFDIAAALAPEPEHLAESAMDEGVVPPEAFEDPDGEPRGWDGDDDGPLGYESAREPALAGLALRGGGWTIPLLCLGIGLIACCLLIPLADSNRRLAYERQRLARDLESIQTQVAVNDEFLRRVHDDPSLAERLAQRQMKTIRQGTRVLELDRTRRASSAADMSPFQLVAVQPPAPLPPYRPLSGTIANLCYRPRTRLYLMGVGLFMMASGLVLGYSPKRS